MSPGVVGHTEPGYRGVAMVFAGAGGQWRGMGAGLWDESPVFRETATACADAFAPYIDWSLTDVLCGVRGAASMNRPDVVQPALFTLMVSVAAVWRSFGVYPAAVAGHSQGEIAAAHVAGALSLDDAARVVALRSRLIAERLVGTGSMLSVPLSVKLVEERLADHTGVLAVAAVNGPSATSVAGDVDAIEKLFAELVDDDVRVARIASDFAAHSPHIDAIHAPLLDALGGIRPRAAGIAFCSSVTGDLAEPRSLDAPYWYQNLRGRVEFEAAVRTLVRLGYRHFVEPSSHPLLTAPIGDIGRDVGADVAAVGSLAMGESGLRTLTDSIATAERHGVLVDWEGARRAGHRNVVPPHRSKEHP
ncbi:Acyl transferase domain-containing protein [Prauserella aidingensis]|uniref:acyltransferase domain-containing protein n=1 Tax=Prauserella aidingensis TaxID=387890 RepID=UPI0020A256A9|nr:acyltransferase domain-containing protein [Prauserella aidingensis]MCP2251342.1 Acyl transferase domain-containing protein [Prauserella aidingensis]